MFYFFCTSRSIWLTHKISTFSVQLFRNQPIGLPDTLMIDPNYVFLPVDLPSLQGQVHFELMFGRCCAVFDNIMKHKTFKDRCTFGSELKVIVRRPNLVEESEEHRNSLTFELNIRAKIDKFIFKKIIHSFSKTAKQ